ncbi:MAG: CoB--CoM heterodisulfide reductase iron-sulfur subunit B family protein [Deltaproteobacteria bacterium]|nr:CoB--CoM heterodisulfide reductase iron-sulfur subunit B family protein [Deltaproteobacteria bacterium]
MNDKKYAIFLGCTVPIKGLNYEQSARNVIKNLGVELVDIPDFACCGFPVTNLHHLTATTLAARNLALAEANGLNILTLCSACAGELTRVQKLLASKQGAKELSQVNAVLNEVGHHYKGSITVKHIGRFLLEEIGLKRLQEAITHPLKGINIAPHYGCHCIRPTEIFDWFDDPIRPEHLDKLIELTGATSVQYKDKMQCCGGGILAFEEETPTKMVKQKLDHIKEAHADAMTLVCPTCDIMYDEYQPTVETKFCSEYKIPVLFYPQLLGLAMGLDPKKDLAVRKNVVRVNPLLEKIERLRSGSDLYAE